MLEERVTQLESTQKKHSTKAVDKNEIAQIVREVMHERDGVFERKDFGTVLNKEKVYARCKQCGYTRHQVLNGLRDAEILVTGNDGHSLKVICAYKHNPHRTYSVNNTMNRGDRDGKKSKRFNSIQLYFV